MDTLLTSVFADLNGLGVPGWVAGIFLAVWTTVVVATLAIRRSKRDRPDDHRSTPNG